MTPTAQSQKPYALPLFINEVAKQSQVISATTTKQDFVINELATHIRLLCTSGNAFIKFGTSVATATTTSPDWVVTEGSILDFGVIANRHMSVISDSTATLYFSSY